MAKKAFAPRELIGENRPTLWMAPLLTVVTLFYLYPAFEVLRITAIFVLASVVLQLALGLLIAVAVNRARRRRLPGMVFMRTVILSTWVMPGVVIGIVWAIILNEEIGRA